MWRQYHSLRPVMVVLNSGGNDGAIGTTLSHGLGAEVVPRLATGLGGEETNHRTRRVTGTRLRVDIDTIRRARDSNHM
jgi:hypothetical protein